MKVKRYTGLDVHEVSFVAAGANQPAFVRLFKSREQKGTPEMKNEPTPEVKKTEEPAAPAAPVVNVEDMTKAVRTAIEKEYAEKFAAQNTELKKLAKQLKVTDKVSFVKSTLKSVPVKAEDLADKLVDLAEVSAPLAQFVEDTLKSCSELIAKSELLKQQGSTEPAVSSVIEKVEKLIEKKRAENPKLTKATAEAAVWRDNPGLYAEYEKELASR